MKRLGDSDRGASAVEYALLIGGITAVIIAIVFVFGGTILGAFTDTCTAVNAAGQPMGC